MLCRKLLDEWQTDVQIHIKCISQFMSFLISFLHHKFRKKKAMHIHSSVHILSYFNWITCLDFWLTFPFGLPLTWADSIGSCADSPEPLLFTCAITALFCLLWYCPWHRSWEWYDFYIHLDAILVTFNSGIPTPYWMNYLLQQASIQKGTHRLNGPQCQKPYLWTCVSYKDSSEPTHSPEYS